MKAVNTSFRQMVATVPAETKREVDLEFAISNRIYELMTKRGTTILVCCSQGGAGGKRTGERF